jgi:uncharacterized metal-binding protein
MEEKCTCEPNEILIFSCSGSSNVGQIGNLAGLKLTREKVGRMFCLAGIGGHVSGMIESTRSGKMIVGIDGCPVGCAKKVLEHAGFKPHEYLQVTEMGIEKNHGFDYPQSEVDRVVDHLKSRISQRRAA